MGECRAVGRRVNMILSKNTQQIISTRAMPVRRRTFRNRLYVYGRGRRSSSRTAHRLRLRSSTRTLAPSLLLSSKSLARFGCSLINALTTPRCRYQLFAVSRGKVLCIHFPSCRERTPRRSNDRFAPSRMVTRDIRPLVLLLLSEKSHAASLLLACKRARDAPTCYQLFSVSSG